MAPSRITPEQVAHVARLSYLEFSPEEQELFVSQLSDVLDYGKEMISLQLDDVPPTSHPFLLNNVLRDDSLTGGTGGGEAGAASAMGRRDAGASESEAGREGGAGETARVTVDRAEVLALAPDPQDNQFRVPPVLEAQD